MDPYQTNSGPNRTFIFFLGLLIGAALLAGGFFVYSKFIDKKTDEPSNLNVTPTKEFVLSVNAPEDGETVSSEQIKISGSTGTASLIVIQGGFEDIILDATNAAFTADYKLVLGENQLTITAYEEDTGESRTETRNILYLNENLETL